MYVMSCGETTFGCTAPRILDCWGDTVHRPLQVLFHLLLAAVRFVADWRDATGAYKQVDVDAVRNTTRCGR